VAVRSSPPNSSTTSRASLTLNSALLEYPITARIPLGCRCRLNSGRAGCRAHNCHLSGYVGCHASRVTQGPLGAIAAGRRGRRLASGSPCSGGPQVLETSGLAWARLHSGTGVGAVALTGLGWGRPPPPKYRLLLGWGSDFGYSSRVVRFFSRDLDNPLEVRRFGFALTAHGLTSPGSVAADVLLAACVLPQGVRLRVQPVARLALWPAGLTAPHVVLSAGR
jgi:hypothetical protein